MLPGIDVSAVGQGMAFNWDAWRGKIAWAAVKISDGTGFADPAAKRNIAGARSIGARVVGYHFLRAAASGAAQAAWFGECAQHAGMERGDAFAVDAEQDGQGSYPPGFFWSVAADFADAIRGHYRFWPWVYTDLSLAQLAPAAVGDCPLWLANPDRTNLAGVGPWKLITAEQTGQKGVDTDAFYGDLAQFARLAYPLAAPAPAAPPAPPARPRPGAAEATAAIKQITEAAGVLTRYVAGSMQ